MIPKNSSSLPPRALLPQIKQYFRQRTTEQILIVVLIVFFIMMIILSPYFLTKRNIINIMRQISINGLISVGMTLVILSGGIDLSVGSILAICGMIMARMVQISNDFGTLGIVLGLLLSIFIGIALGSLNGYLVGYFRVPPFVTTLGMMSIARGITFIYSDGQPIPNLSPNFLLIGTGFFLGIPIPFYIFLFCLLFFSFLLKRVPFGRNLYAVGASPKCAYLSGINIKLATFSVYLISGLMSAIAGIILTARTTSGLPQAGVTYELDAIAAVVIGGASLSGGKGSLLGTFLGVLLIGILGNSLNLLGVSSYYQQVTKGVIIVLAVLIDSIRE